MDRDGAGAAGQRRRGGRVLSHAQPRQPRAAPPRDVAATRPSRTSSPATCTRRPPHAGRGGWSWYTGSAGWMYRAGLESILGLRRRGETFIVDPCIPSSWPSTRSPGSFATAATRSRCPTLRAGAGESRRRRSTARRSMRGGHPAGRRRPDARRADRAWGRCAANARSENRPQPAHDVRNRDDLVSARRILSVRYRFTEPCGRSGHQPSPKHVPGEQVASRTRSSLQHSPRSRPGADGDYSHVRPTRFSLLRATPWRI